MYHVPPKMHKLHQLHYPTSGPKKLLYPKFHFTRVAKHIWIILEFSILIETAIPLLPWSGKVPRKGFQTVCGLLLLQPVGQAPEESVGILNWQTPGKLRPPSGQIMYSKTYNYYESYLSGSCINVKHFLRAVHVLPYPSNRCTGRLCL